MSDWILTRTGLDKLDRKNNITESMKALYNTTKTEQIQRLFWCGRISLVILIIAIFNVFSMLSLLMNSDSKGIREGKYLERPNYGEGSREVELNVTMKQKKASSNEEEFSGKEEFSEEEESLEKKASSEKEAYYQKDESSGKKESSGNKKSTKEGISQKVSIAVEERSYTEEELEVIFTKSFDYLKAKVLSENESADKIYYNLNFCKSVPGTSIKVDWEPQDNDLIEFDGTVCNEGIDKLGISTYVTVVLSYHNKKAERRLSFKIMPRQYSQEEILSEKLHQEIAKSSKKSANDNFMELPDSIDNYNLSWGDEKKEHNDGALLLLGIVMAIVAWVSAEKDLEKKMKKRKEQMLLDYPELVNKFTLLINAGMTIKQAWNKIVEDYITKSGQERGDKRYAYEEMLTTANELKLGMPENVAYEQYGRRIALIPYIKFSSLISQNLKKGNKGFTDLMMKEAMEAFEERKEAAKRLGEEVGTKLLIPMMLMLLMVFMIIMIPAFMAFKI